MRYKLNHLAIWLLVIVQTGIAALWYSPLVLGTQWMNLLGLTPQAMSEGILLPFAVAIGGTVLLTYFLAWLLLQLDVAYFSEAFKVGFLLWLAAIVTEHATHYAFQSVPWGVLAIDMGKTLVCILLSALVLTAWRTRAN